MEQFPGLVVHVNEGRISGTFEMPPADMQHIRYQGRVVLVLVADATNIRVGDTRDGDTKASWTFKGVDAAIVRDKGMKDHLAKTLYLDGLDTPPPLRRDDQPVGTKAMVGVYDDEGAFMGFESPDEGDIPAIRDLTPDYQDDEDDDEFVPEPVVRVEPPHTIESADPVLQRFLNEDVTSGV